MDAAEHLLYEVGYAGVTTRAVAEAAGVNHGLVHYYFGSMRAAHPTSALRSNWPRPSKLSMPTRT